MSELPKTANVVIIGGGIMGASTAYHLASRGFKDILLLEKENFFCRSYWSLRRGVPSSI